MLLETLDIKKDDIVIYSQNIFDLENNYKIIFKDDPDKKVRKIGFYDVCHFVNEYSPKNLIVYRLMTNITDFSLHTSKFGFKIYIAGEPEIIYFDPIFAIKELEEYPGTVDESLRFRIQQIGLTTLSRVDNNSNFAEIYSIDLRPHEAKYQKDKAFADAIFALNAEYNAIGKIIKGSTNTKTIQKQDTQGNNNNSSQLNDIPAKNKMKDTTLSSVFKNIKSDTKITKADHSANKESDKTSSDVVLIKHDISEDKNFDYKQILKMKFLKPVEGSKDANEFPRIIKNESEKKYSFREFLDTSTGFIGDKKDEVRGMPLNNIFKSPEPLKKIVEERQEEKVVLKLNKK